MEVEMLGAAVIIWFGTVFFGSVDHIHTGMVETYQSQGGDK